MTFNAHYLQLPAQGRGSSLLMRFTIIILDFIAFVCLCVNLGLYHKWVAKTQDVEVNLTGYQETGMSVPAVRYWQYPIVMVVVLLSLIWTTFIYLRPAWTRKPLHLGTKMVSELLLFLIILACSIPAFIFSPLQPAKLIYLIEEVDGYCIYGPHGSGFYCAGDTIPLQRLEVAGYALVWAVAFFHFCLFCSSIYEYRNPVKDFEAGNEGTDDESVTV